MPDPVTSGSNPAGASVPEPPEPTKKWIRYVLAFGVGTSVGLAPFLGYIHVPGFTALVELFPDSLRTRLFGISAMLMGTIAVTLQFLFGEGMRGKWIKYAFIATVPVMLAALVALVMVLSYATVTVPIPVTNDEATFVVGFEARPLGCEACPAPISDLECITQELGVSEAAVSSCWGDSSIRQATALLWLAYLLTTGLFTVLVGLLILRGPRGPS